MNIYREKRIYRLRYYYSTWPARERKMVIIVLVNFDMPM